MILPQTITLPVGPIDYGRHRTGKSQHYKEKEYIYIPLLLQLEKYLNFADVSEAISKPKDNLSNIYAHFEDGLYFQGNIFFQSHPDALQLLVYIDECGMTGDRGNRSKKNKLVFVYGCLGNLERKHRSSFKSMFVISIFHNTVMTRFGLNVLLRPLVDDIKKLELGVNMSVGGKSTIVRGTLAAIVADNLASHQIGGFKVGFGKGFRKCRFCLGTSEDIKNKCFDNEFFPRTKIQHEQHCSSLHSEELRDHFQRTYGVMNDSILNELKHFHVIGGLAPDLMHDILEGLIPLILSKLIVHCIQKKYFTLNTLNDAIAKFKYGYREMVNKPCPISMSSLYSGKIDQSASQLWLMAINFPLIVGNLVDAGDETWHCFLLLLQISRLVFLDSISSSQLLILEQLIEEFIIAYKANFYQSYQKGNKNYLKKCEVTPKMHHLVHYPRFIRLLGPLTSFWCMRFEAKHSYFKSLQRRIHNFINSPLTLATRHQQWQCNEFMCVGEKFLEFQVRKSHFTIKLLSNYACAGQIASLLNLDIISGIIVHSLKWVEIGTNKFIADKSMILVPLNNAIKRCAFGLVASIISYGKKIIFVCEVYQTVDFNNHFQAIRIRKRKRRFLAAISPFHSKDFSVFQYHSAGFCRSVELYVTARTEIKYDVF